MGTIGHAAFDAYYDGGLTGLISGGTVAPVWSDDGKRLSYVDGATAWEVDLQSGERCELPQPPAGPPPGPVAPREFLSERLGVFDPLPVLEMPSPDGAYLLSTTEHNIVVRSTVDGRELALTQDGTPENRWRLDVVDPVIVLFTPGLAVTNWSPDGSRIAVYRDDYSGMGTIPQVHNLKSSDEIVYRYCAPAGGTLERTTLYALDLYGRPPVKIDLGDTTDQLVMYASWMSGGRELLILRVSRDCKKADVLVANATTGRARLVLSEEGDTFVRIFHDVYTGRKTGLWVVPDGKHLLWRSERSGTNQLYMYDLEGSLVRQLTSAEYPVDYVQRIDDEFVYFTAHSDRRRPYDVHLQRVPLAAGEVETLTENTGMHSVQFSPGGAFFVDTWSRPDQPPSSVLRRADGTLVSGLSVADRSRLDELGWVPPREFTVTAADGETELWGTMFFPNDFDENETYPIIEHIYAGPYWLVAPHSFEHLWYTKWSQALAQLGYIVVMLDSRGTPERNKQFHDFIVDNWAGSIDDHAEMIRQLAERESFIDGDRVGVIGHSWGGYFTFRALTDRPDVYKHGISVSPAFDVFAPVSVLYECYMGFPQENRAVYDAAQTFPLVEKLPGDFMIVCGPIDHVTWPDAVKMAEALIRAGKPHEFVVVPEQGHFFDPAHDRHFWRKVAEVFGRNLQGRGEHESVLADAEPLPALEQTTPPW
jgi:dipeptidyl aminopeptidase/acylaminoacyl peptidase